MATTTVTTGLQEQQWRNKFFSEFLRANRFTNYMGASANSVIHVVEDFMDAPGEKLSIPLITRLKSAGVSGDTALAGAEAALSNYEFKLSVDWRRNAYNLTKKQMNLTGIDLLNAGREFLLNWCMEQLRGGNGAYQGNIDGIIDALMSFRPGGVQTRYANATEANKDAWLVSNSDRVVFGALKSNFSSLDHSTSLANIDNTADKMTAALVTLAHTIAMDADPHIRPFKINKEEEWYVLFCNSRHFRDLKNDTTISQANRDARVRGLDNPIFTSGSLVYDGVVIVQVPEIGYITGAGAGGIDVGASFLCGAQAVCAGWGQRPKPIEEVSDFKFRKSIGTEEIAGVEKTYFNGKQHGVVTIYAAAVADA